MKNGAARAIEAAVQEASRVLWTFEEGVKDMGPESAAVYFMLSRALHHALVEASVFVVAVEAGE